MTPAKPLAERKNVQEVLAKLPQSPGVYLMKDARNEVIYVGKANHLRNRVRCYFRTPRKEDRPAVRFLQKRVFNIETLVTESEKAALLLENTIIKKFKPRYNVQLRDDKTFLGIRLSLNDPIPRLSAVRRPQKDGAVYFGPFASAGSLRKVIRLLQKSFGIRVCTDTFFRNRIRPCIEYQIGRCLGPCIEGLVSPEDYQNAVKETDQFLRGNAEDLLKGLKNAMKEASSDENFEEAMKYRDQIEAIEETLKQQVVASHRRDTDQDVFGLFRQEGFSELYILFVREGQVVGGKSYHLGNVFGSDEEIICSALLQRYTQNQDGVGLPAEIILPSSMKNTPFLSETLKEHWGKRSLNSRKNFQILSPQRGEKHKLALMALENAKANFFRERRMEQRHQKVLDELRQKLKLPRFPQRMECYDISNLQGHQSVGSMVVFENGEADKKSYRHFKIRHVKGINDFEMLKEVLSRRLQRKELLPDLLLVDGGKGQLKMAQEAFKELGVENVSLAALAKARRQEKNPDRWRDRIFLPGRSNPVFFKPGSGALGLLQRIRNEAHRFALSHHRKLRGKSFLGSPLEEVPGIGPARRKKLLQVFGSLENIQAASSEDLIKKGRLPESVAKCLARVLEK